MDDMVSVEAVAPEVVVENKEDRDRTPDRGPNFPQGRLHAFQSRKIAVLVPGCVVEKALLVVVKANKKALKDKNEDFFLVTLRIARLKLIHSTFR